MKHIPINPQASFALRLGVIGAPAHWSGPDGALWAYEPYVREMRIWADLFASVHICGHAPEGGMRGNLAPYLRENVEVHQVHYTQAVSPAAPWRRLCALAELRRQIRRVLRETDFALIRSPSHFGLVGLLEAWRLKKASITKWAGENAAYAGERLPSRVNRVLETWNFPGHCTLVYGQPKAPHHISFLPALMTGDELAAARRMADGRIWRPPWKILAVGRLAAPKGFDLAIRGLGELYRAYPDLPWTFTLVGDGFERGRLEQLARDCGIEERVTFPGALPFREVQEYYAAAHMVIMPGVKEGWPKILAEAWAHGALPVGAAAGLVPWILREPDSGVVFRPRPRDLAAVVHGLLSAPDRLQEMAAGLYRYAAELSLEHFQHRLEQVLIERFGLTRWNGVTPVGFDQHQARVG